MISGLDADRRLAPATGWWKKLTPLPLHSPPTSSMRLQLCGSRPASARSSWTLVPPDSSKSGKNSRAARVQEPEAGDVGWGDVAGASRAAEDRRVQDAAEEVSAEDVEPAVADESAGGCHAVEDLLDRGPNLLRRSTPLGRPDAVLTRGVGYPGKVV